MSVRCWTGKCHASVWTANRHVDRTQGKGSIYMTIQPTLTCMKQTQNTDFYWLYNEVNKTCHWIKFMHQVFFFWFFINSGFINNDSNIFFLNKELWPAMHANYLKNFTLDYQFRVIKCRWFPINLKR